MKRPHRLQQRAIPGGAGAPLTLAGKMLQGVPDLSQILDPRVDICNLCLRASLHLRGSGLRVGTELQQFVDLIECEAKLLRPPDEL